MPYVGTKLKCEGYDNGDSDPLPFRVRAAPLELDAVERLQAAGHKAFAPDLYDGWVASSIDEGFGLKDEIGWQTICERAEWAMAGLPPSTVLAGFSMGAAVAASLWPKRPQTAGVLFLA